MKPWYLSKTIWANIVAALLTFGSIAGLDLGLTPEDQAQLVAGVLVVVNIVLRFVTNEAIGGK